MLTNEQMLKVIRTNQKGIIECDKRITELEKVKNTCDINDFKIYRHYRFMNESKIDVEYINTEIELEMHIRQCLESQIKAYRHILSERVDSK